MNEIEQKAVRKDGDVTMCDLLNKEIEELTNQKEIEEMAKVICQQQYFNTHCVEHCNLKGYCCECTDLATNLYNAGYRNCKDKVVVSKEEFEKHYVQRELYDHVVRYRCLPPEFGKIVNEAQVQTRKETAREIFDKIIWYAVKRIGQTTNDSYYQISFDRLKELAKQYGVEVE